MDMAGGLVWAMLKTCRKRIVPHRRRGHPVKKRAVSILGLGIVAVLAFAAVGKADESRFLEPQTYWKVETAVKGDRPVTEDRFAPPTHLWKVEVPCDPAVLSDSRFFCSRLLVVPASVKVPADTK